MLKLLRDVTLSAQDCSAGSPFDTLSRCGKKLYNFGWAGAVVTPGALRLVESVKNGSWLRPSPREPCRGESFHLIKVIVLLPFCACLRLPRLQQWSTDAQHDFEYRKLSQSAVVRKDAFSHHLPPTSNSSCLIDSCGIDVVTCQNAPRQNRHLCCTLNYYTPL